MILWAIRGPQLRASGGRERARAVSSDRGHAGHHDVERMGVDHFQTDGAANYSVRCRRRVPDNRSWRRRRTHSINTRAVPRGEAATVTLKPRHAAESLDRARLNHTTVAGIHSHVISTGATIRHRDAPGSETCALISATAMLLPTDHTIKVSNRHIPGPNESTAR